MIIEKWDLADIISIFDLAIITININDFLMDPTSSTLYKPIRLSGGKQL